MPDSAKAKSRSERRQTRQETLRRTAARPRPAPDIPLFLGGRASRSAGWRAIAAVGCADPTDNAVAIGGSGFGVMAIIVACERGWVTREQALARFAAHAGLPGEGHLLSRHVSRISCTATRAPLCLSAARMTAPISWKRRICSRGFCASAPISIGDVPEETRLRQRITYLWHEAEWNWYTQGGRNGADLALESQQRLRAEP